MYLLNSPLSFLGPYIDVSFKVSYKFPWTVDRCMS